MFLIIILIIIAHSKPSKYNPSWKERFMDRQTADSDMMAAARLAKQFNDNLHHEVRVATNREPIPHLGEFPTTMKLNPVSYERKPSSGDRIRGKLDEMVSQEPEFALKVGWQDDEDQYQRVLEQLISLEPGEQADLVLKIMRNEKRSNNSRIISRLRTFISMIEDGVLGISIEELHMICVKTNYEMQIEQAMLQELGVSLDPIRNQIIEEENLMIGEDEVFEEQAPDEAYEVPIEYRPINKKQKLVTSTEMPEEPEIQDEVGEAQDEAEIQDEAESQQPKKSAHHEAMHEDLMGPVEDLHHHPQIKRKIKYIDDYVVHRRPDIRREITPQPLIYPTRLPRQVYNDYSREPVHLVDEYYDDEARIPVDIHHVNTRYVHQQLIPHKNPHYNQPNHDVLAVFGRNQQGPYFNYDKHALHQEPRSNDIAQSINIVTGADNIEKQSISISKDEPMQSINIVFDDTMAEINKEQDLYHRYRNQKHQINRDSFRHPEDRQYPDIHTGSILDKPKKPYYNQPQMPFYVPSSPYESINPYPDPYFMDAPYPIDNQGYPPFYPPPVFDLPPEYIDPLAGPMPMVLDPSYALENGDQEENAAAENPAQDEDTENKAPEEEKTVEEREHELEEQKQKEEEREEKEDKREEAECKREEAEDKREEQEDKREAEEEKRDEEEEKREEEEEKREEQEEKKEEEEDKKEEEEEKKEECEIKEEIEEQKEELQKHKIHHEEEVVEQQPEDSKHEDVTQTEAQSPAMTAEQQYAAAILYCQNNRLDPFCLQFGDPFDVSVKYDKNDPRSFGIYEKDLFGRDGQPVPLDQRQNFNPSRAIGKELEREGLVQPGGFPLGYRPGQPGLQPGFQAPNPYGQGPYGQPYGIPAPYGGIPSPYGGLPNDYLPYGQPYYGPPSYDDYYRTNGDPDHDQLVRDRQKRLREYHIYEHYLDYKDKRGKYDSRTKGEREEDRKRSYVTKDLQKKTVKIRTDPDEDDWADRPKSKASQHDTAGREFSKTLKQQRQAEKDQELEDQQLQDMGIKPQDKKPKSKQPKKPKTKAAAKQDSSEYEVQGLAANEHEVKDSSSLNNQHQNDNRKEERQKDLKYQARGNSEKSQENKELNKPEPALNNLIQISQQQSQCRGILERDRLFVCTECNATEVFILNDESWYLISLSKGYKQEFHHFFKYFRELVNPKYLLTSFGDRGICFASNHEQTVNITNLLQLVQKNLTASFIKIQDMVTMNYFQLKYVNSKQFSNFALEITSKEHFDRWGMNVNKLNLNFNDQQYSITYSGTLQAHSKLKFTYEEQNSNVNIQTFTLYVNIPHDITVADSIIRNYFQPEYQQLLQSYLQNAPHGASILQVRRHQSEQLFDIQISLRS